MILSCLLYPEMRQKYDQGEDPLDPENGQGGGGGGHPFRQGGHTFHFPGWSKHPIYNMCNINFQGGHPFGGGQFKFHFN